MKSALCLVSEIACIVYEIRCNVYEIRCNAQGSLHIKPIAEKHTFNGTTRSYTSARLRTYMDGAEDSSWTYGRFQGG